MKNSGSRPLLICIQIYVQNELIMVTILHIPYFATRNISFPVFLHHSISLTPGSRHMLDSNQLHRC